MATFAEDDKRKKQPDDPKIIDNGEELLFITKKDIYRGQAVIGPAPMDFYANKIVNDLVAEALKNIKPEIVEKNGYELVQYELVIKQRPYKVPLTNKEKPA